MFYLDIQHLVSIILQDSLYSIIEVGVPDSGTVQSREQIPNEPQEQGDILKHKLGQVHVSQSSHQHNILQTHKLIFFIKNISVFSIFSFNFFLFKFLAIYHRENKVTAL